MAKFKQNQNQQSQQPAEDPADKIEQFRRCPVCWGEHQGVGVRQGQAQKGGLLIRYYKCVRTVSNEAGCGHTWSAPFTPAMIAVEHFSVEVQTRQ